MSIRLLLKYFLQILVFVAIYLAADSYQTRNMLSVELPKNAPEKRLISIEGQVEPLLATEQRTLIYFFAPWCKVCALSIGSLNAIENNSINVVAVALDFDSVESVQQFVIEHGVQDTVLLGNEMVKQEFKVPGYPSYYLIDEQGQVVAKSFGLNTSIGIRIRDWLSR